MACVLTISQAEQLVKNVAKEHGYLSPEFLQMLDPSHRRAIQEALLNKDLIIGSSVMTLAKNLYTRKSRFVFELLQNAEDNKYEQAWRQGDLPHVSFQVHPDRIVIDCNEDGFMPENLAAICAVGKSSKHGTEGYIGEKGIGFKSVFMVAWKVHIQSGPFSFSFTHRNGDSGMGMISPVWEAGHGMLASPLTRMTLYLHEPGAGATDADLAERTRQSTREQFEQLQETTLLFLKKIAKLDVLFYDADGALTSSTRHSVSRPSETVAVLRKIRMASGSDPPQETTSHFRVATHHVTGLAMNDNRSYSDTEIAQRRYATSEVVVAFPIAGDGVPIVEPQDLFVFLPVRHVGFSFLIQADFVTDASRQDVVADSLRNIGLIGGIAKAFVQGVVQLAAPHSTDSSIYQWMRYLPQRAGQHWDGLWSTLVDKIYAELSGAAVLLGRLQPERRLIRDLLRLRRDCLDDDGEPLFGDSQPERVISRRYQASHLDMLSEYGLRYADVGDAIGWAEEDLHRGPAGRMQSAATSPRWHTLAAKLLCHAFRVRNKAWRTRMLNLQLLPLHDGTWAWPAPTGSPGAIYFAQSGGLDIPPDVGLRLISPDVTDPERKALFGLLNVKEAPLSFVKASILSIYIGKVDAHTISLAASKRHLRFLYLTGHIGFDSGESCSIAQVVTEDGDLKPAAEVHKHSDDPYGASELFRKTAPGPDPGDGAPGYQGHEDSSFISEEYFKDSPPTPQGQELSWLEWFYGTMHIQRNVCLVRRGEFLPAGSYVHRHRPEKFLGALKVGHELRNDGLGNEDIELLQKTAVLCRGSGYTELRYAYYPTTELLRRVAKLVEPGAFFPWLYLEETAGSHAHDAVPADWKMFLMALGITAPTDLDFALAMLRYSQAGFPQTATASSRSRLFDLYEHISTRQSEASDDLEAAKKVQNLFNEQKRIYIPTDAGGHTWALPSECVWNAPQVLLTKHALRLLYEPCHRADNRDGNTLAGLFRTTLGIRNCTWETYIGELKGLKAVKVGDIATVFPIYKALDAQRRKLGQAAQAAIKLAFESDALICASSDGQTPWRDVAQCIWSPGAKLRGRASLDEHYESLQDFFVGFLGVKPVDLEMAIAELRDAGGEADKVATTTTTTTTASVNALKESIWMVNSLLLSSSARRPPSSEDVVSARIFPIRMPGGGQVTCGSSAAEFCIVDRESLGQAFASKVKLLDFTLEEVSRLHPFLCWTQLQDRFLSRSVREVTSFHGEGAELVSKTDRQICHRAYGLLRIACHFRSPRTETREDVHALYDMLKAAEVYETSGISSDLKLAQDGTDHAVVGDIATLHIEEAPTGLLKVYLPRNKDDQKFVFVTTLGEKLFEWMMRQPSEKTSASLGLERGTKATQDVLMAPRSRTDMVLERNGIALIGDVEDTDGQADSEPESELAVSTPRPRAAAAAAAAAVSLINGAGLDGSVSDIDDSSRTLSRIRRGDDNDEDAEDTAVVRQSSSFRASTPFGRLPITAPATPESGMATRAADTAYTTLLGHVIDAARNKTIPASSGSSFGMSQLLASLMAADGSGDDTTLLADAGLHGAASSSFERDCRVGAAGELYVFELLSGLPGERLPGFGRDSWQSSMRRYVTSHPKYADMAAWSGRETSDIVYRDAAGVLTGLLIQQGYLDDGGSWAGARPQYYIEVKTTTSGCDTPFFMSKAQYKRMQENTLTPANRSSIYVVFRVYNLGRANMGLAVYVDPEALRVASQLEFTGENWSVVPRQGVR